MAGQNAPRYRATHERGQAPSERLTDHLTQGLGQAPSWQQSTGRHLPPGRQSTTARRAATVVLADRLLARRAVKRRRPIGRHGRRRPRWPAVRQRDVDPLQPAHDDFVPRPPANGTWEPRLPGRGSPARRACACMSCHPSRCRACALFVPSTANPALAATRQEAPFAVEWSSSKR